VHASVQYIVLEDRLPEDQFFHLYLRNRIGRHLVVLFLAIGFASWREALPPPSAGAAGGIDGSAGGVIDI
jgi:hypothetical protein